MFMDKDNSIKVFVILERYLIDIDEGAKVLAVCKTLDSAKKVMNKESEFIKNNFKIWIMNKLIMEYSRKKVSINF